MLFHIHSLRKAGCIFLDAEDADAVERVKWVNSSESDCKEEVSGR